MTKKTNTEELILPEFNLKFIEFIFLMTQYIFKDIDLSDFDDLPTIIEKAYHDEDIFKKLDKKIFKTKKQILIKDSDNFVMELLQSFYRLRLSIRLTYDLNTDERVKMLERISYYKENFHNEYFIFTERVIRYLKTLKNEYKEYKQILIKISSDYQDIFKPYRDLRNDHIHLKRNIESNYYKTVIADLADKYEVKSNLPNFGETFENMKSENISSM